MQSFSEVSGPLQAFPEHLPESLSGSASVHSSQPLAKEETQNSQTMASEIGRRAADIGGRAYSANA